MHISLKSLFKISLSILLFFNITTAHGNNRNRCMDFFNIHAGYNALTNITEQALGIHPDLQYCHIIYNHFPKENEAMKAAARFIMEFAVKENHPPLDSLLSISSYGNGQTLSWLTLCSRYAGDIKYRQYFKKFKQEPLYEMIYFQTIVWSYPVRWEGKMENPEAFIKDLDAVLVKQHSVPESETVLYNLFKLELEYENSKDETAFLEKLSVFFNNNRKYLSVTNYNQYLKDYFPQHAASAAISKTVNDSYDVHVKNPNPIYKSYVNIYHSLNESIEAIEQNPFNKTVFNYRHTSLWLKKEQYTSIISALDKLNKLETEYSKVCNIPALSFDFIRLLVEGEIPKLTSKQTEELKVRLLKKWLDFHIACNITLVFYMDQNIIDHWNELSKPNQVIVDRYFEKESVRTGNTKYYAEMKKVLKMH